MHNLRAWNEWSDKTPDPNMRGCIEAEYVDERGHLSYAIVWQFHYSDERGSLWGHTAGSIADGSWKTFHPTYHRWRFTGPLVPSKEAQGSAIIIWEWKDAPGELRCLSPHGGDEDYVALLRKDMYPPSWLESGTTFGSCDVSSHCYEDGRTVLIGAHA